MNHRLHAVRHTLSEASECYDMMVRAAGAPNIDRVGYTSQIKLDVFRDILDRPDLTIDDLSALLRAARNEVWEQLDPFTSGAGDFLDMSEQKVPDGDAPRQLQPHQQPEARIPRPVVANAANDPGCDWATLMARVVLHRANEEGSPPAAVAVQEG